MTKIYLALVAGRPNPQEADIDAPIGRHPHDRAANGRRFDWTFRADPLLRLDVLRRRFTHRGEAKDRPHASNSRSHGVDRPSGGRRCGVWAPCAWTATAVPPRTRD